VLFRSRLLRDAPRPLANATAIGFHTGTAEAVGKVTLLDRDTLAPGAETWAQVRLQSPVAVAKGDLFIIRQLSPGITLGGGQIVDPAPARRHRRRQAAVLTALETLARGTPDEVVLQTVERHSLAEPAAIVAASGLDGATARAALDSLLANGQVVALGPAVLTRSAWQRLSHQASEHLQQFHRQFPLRPGMPREELKSRLQLPTRRFNDALARLVAEGAIAEAGTAVHLPNHRVRLSPDQASLSGQLLDHLARAPFAPPSLGELRGELGATLDEELLAALASLGKIVRVSEDLAFTAEAYRQMVETIVAHLRDQRTITVAEVRDRFGTSRRYVLALLEHLDRERITRRVGDERVLATGRLTLPPLSPEPAS
jgi:selenocysteine-specific elongation factor